MKCLHILFFHKFIVIKRLLQNWPYTKVVSGNKGKTSAREHATFCVSYGQTPKSRKKNNFCNPFMGGQFSSVVFRILGGDWDKSKIEEGKGSDDQFVM